MDSNREKIVLGGYETWLDRGKQMLFESPTAQHGIHYDTDGIMVWSLHLTKDECRELIGYLNYKPMNIKTVSALSLLVIIGFGFLAIKFYIVGFMLCFIGGLSFGLVVKDSLK